jgi:hypothetical protein
MTLWWVIPWFVTDLTPDLVTYMTIFLVSGGFAFGLGILDEKYGLWKRSGFWGRYLLLCGAYGLQMTVTLVVVITLDSFHSIRYYAGCPAGSIGMLFFPSIVFNFILAAAIGGIVSLISSIGRGVRKKIPSQTETPPNDGMGGHQ